MSPVVLITGANRGIGLELARLYLARGCKVVGAVRTPDSMPNLAGDLVVVKLDSREKGDAKAAMASLAAKGITHLDIVIANAGINLSIGATFAEVDVDDQLETFYVNVRAPLLLYQATLDLIDPKTGKFIIVGSEIGNIGRKHASRGNGIYGQSKAAISYFVAKAHAEEPERVIMAVDPGWVPTDMGKTAEVLYEEAAPDDIAVTIPALLKVIDEAKKDTTSGLLVIWDGTVVGR